MTNPTDSGVARTGRSGGARAVGWVAGVLLLAVAVVAGYLVVSGVQDKRADDRAEKDRRQVVSVAEQFTLRLDDIDYQKLDSYSKGVSALLTPKMKADFAQSLKGFESAFAAVQIKSKGTIKAAGISDIDADSATVLVIHDVAVTSKGCAQPPYKRMKVDLRKIKGAWLVDDFQEGVPGCQGGGTGQ